MAALRGLSLSQLIEEEVRSPVLTVEPFFAGVGRPVESWMTPTEREVAKVGVIAGQYGFEIGGPPRNAEHRVEMKC